MLSKNERLYLQGKLKVKGKEPNNIYKRRLHNSIKLKIIKAFEDFPLLLNLPEKKRIDIFCDDRLVADAAGAIFLMWRKAQGFFEEWENKETTDGRTYKVPVSHHARRIGALMMRLEKAKIPYDVFKLNRSAEYRRQIDRKLKQAEKSV